MNNFFRYVGREINPYEDADFMQPDFPKDDYHLPKQVRGLEENEAVRFVKGENVVLGNIDTTKDNELVYVASVYTKRHCDPQKLAHSIRHWVAYCLLGHKTPEVDVIEEDGKRRYEVIIRA